MEWGGGGGGGGGGGFPSMHQTVGGSVAQWEWNIHSYLWAAQREGRFNVKSCWWRSVRSNSLTCVLSYCADGGHGGRLPCGDAGRRQRTAGGCSCSRGHQRTTRHLRLWQQHRSGRGWRWWQWGKADGSSCATPASCYLGVQSESGGRRCSRTFSCSRNAHTEETQVPRTNVQRRLGLCLRCFTLIFLMHTL